MAAGVGAGIFETLSLASKELVVWDKEYLPNLGNKKIYDDIKEKWIKIYNKQLELVDSDLTNSMWKAPGV